MNKTGTSSGLRAFYDKHKSSLLIILIIIVGAALILGGSESDASDDTDIEAELEELCASLSGVGACRVMVTYKVVDKRYGYEGREVVESVTVVCKGADKVGVRAELTSMLSSLFGIGTNRIHISKMK